MPSKKNINQVEEVRKDLKKAKSVILVDYLGLKVDQINDLRNQVIEAGGQLQVIKNTLLKIALKELDYKTEDCPLTGPTALLLSFEDEISPLKTLYEFSLKNDLPKIKAGYLAKDLLEKEKVIDLAKLPSQPELQAKLVATLKSPIFSLVYVLKANLNSLAYVLKAIKEKKEKTN
ncbi:50S ribosomal protein L10 [Candidatus Beckwithbacteria bacterium CG10_big_fil_rev_8_21_14_0_10_34_10]|uniref:Large ribosomal subunit protein uL10 n=1 Tax=Candidatus Beckwithbacteria bacterium CG10_big_fil_rev_8_21_14_0_10_34_10 TaxID=1974495 RepID=A0A2H0W873_9BACT|nr:MAG: 50S ribosomal protein L10 [Candidatus Beckwithbacteria bacterium CG10_big_fil_rev_8_21_14_0_10_34_10]